MNLSTLITILTILFIHWFADFVLQTDQDAKGKSKSLNRLLSHTLSYSLIWLLVSVIHLMAIHNVYILLFSPITFLCHTATDYYTSKAHSALYAEERTHEFFVSIGFDQWLHYVQLFTTYYLLINL